MSAYLIHLIEPKPCYNCQTLGNLNQFLFLLLLLLSHDFAQLVQVKLVLFILNLFQQSHHLNMIKSVYIIIKNLHYLLVFKSASADLLVEQFQKHFIINIINILQNLG